MNWQVKGDVLEILPSFEKFEDFSWERDNYFGKNFPYRRLKRWVEAAKGKHIDQVISDFVNLPWIPKTHKFAHTLKDYIEMDTFMDGERVAYHCKYIYKNRYYIEDSHSVEVYVHPVTRLVCVFIPPTQPSWQKKRQEELDKKVRILADYCQIAKMDGIWYLIEGEPQPEYALNWNLQRKGPKDPLMEENSTWDNKNSKKPFVKIVYKHQLNRKELKKYGVVNDRV